MCVPTDCAVCDEGYSPGYSYTCKSCKGDSKRHAVGITSTMLGVVLVLVVMLIRRLVAVEETSTRGKVYNQPLCHAVATSCFFAL